MLRSSILAATLLLSCAAAHAQSTVQATISGVPPLLPSPYVETLVSDFDAGQFALQVSVIGVEPVTASWRATLRRDGRELFSAVSDPVEYEPGTYDYRTFDDRPSIQFNLGVSDVINRIPSEVQLAVVQTGALPEGFYTVELEPVVEEGLGIAGVAEFEVRLPDPPEAIAPSGGEAVAQAPLFTWTPVVTTLAGGGITYRVRVVEVRQGQTPQSAIASERPLFDEDIGTQTTLAYPPDAPPLEAGQQYAWAVSAVADGALPIRNEGVSEVQAFVYEPIGGPPVAANEPPSTPPPASRPVRSTLPPTSSTLPPALPPRDPGPGSVLIPLNLEIPEVRATGRVEWRMPGGGSGPLAEALVQVVGTVEGQRQVLVTAATDGSGAFAVLMPNPALAGSALFGAQPRDVRVEASFPGAAGTLFTFATLAFPSVPAGTPSVDLGTITATAETFRVSASATDRRTGTRVEGMTVAPLRTEGHVRTYDFLGFDGGERLQPGAPRVTTPDGLLTLVATASPTSGQTGPLLAAPTELAPVWALLQAPGYYDRVVEITPTGSDVRLTTELDARGAVITGRVLQVGSREPLTDARLTVRAGASRYEVWPDDDGRFTFEGMTANGQEAHFRVYYGGRVVHEEALTLNPGTNLERDPLLITTEPVAVIGTVRDTDGDPVPNATVIVKGGAMQSETADAGGQYVFALSPGTYTISGEKVGYEVERLRVVVNADGSTTQEPIGSGPSPPPAPPVRWTRPFTEWAATGQGLAVLGDEQARIDRFGTANPLVQINPDITLDRQTAAVVFHVFLGDLGLSGAPVRIGEGQTPVTTGADGRTAPVRLPLGTHTAVLQPFTVGGLTLAPRAVTFVVTQPDAVSPVPKVVDLVPPPGSWASGVVMGDGRPLSGATVQVSGGLSVETGADGTFRVVVENFPYYNYTASKPGWNRSSRFVYGRTGASVALELQPQPAGTPTITALLGFPVRVSSITQEGGGYRVSGEVTEVRGNALAKAPGGRLTFSNVLVQMQDGVALPQGGRVPLGQTELPVEVFGLRGVLHASGGLALVGERGQNGAVVGTLSLDLAGSYPSKAGWSWTQPRVPLSVPGLPTTADGVALLPANGQLPNVSALRFASETALKVQGFDFTAGTESAVTASGLRLNGRVTLASLDGSPKVSAPQVDITNEGRVGASRLAFDPPQAITQDKWTLTLKSGRFADGAVLLDGSARMDQRGADPFDATFTKLRVTKDDLFDGSFVLPRSGVTLIKVLSMTTPAASPYALGTEEEDGERTLFLAGDGEIGFSKFIGNTLPVSEFKLASDGAVELKAEVGLETEFAGVLNYKISSFEYGAVGAQDMLGLKLEGEVTLDNLKNDKAKAGIGISFLESGLVQVNEFELEYEISNVGKVNVGFAFLAEQTGDLPEMCGDVAEGDGAATGFCGKGGFELEKLNKGLDVNVHFLSRGNGVTFGAGLVVGIPDVAIGTTGLFFSKPGGGFSYNTGPKTFAVYIQGDITVGPSSAGTGMQPVKVSVKSGPVVEGSGTLTVAEEEFGSVTVTLNVSEQFFSILGKVGSDLMPGVSLSGDIGMVVGAENKKGYFFLGAKVSADLVNFFNANVALATGYQYPIAKHSDFAVFTNHIPGEYRQGNQVSGIHIDARVTVGTRKESCAGIFAVYLCSYAYNDTYAKLNKSFKTTRFDMAIGSDWGVGGRGRAIALTGEASANLSGRLAGSYNDAQGWAVNGTIRGELKAAAGICPTRCEGICKPFKTVEEDDCDGWWGWVKCTAKKTVRVALPPSGFSVCPSCTVTFDYQQRSPNKKSFDFDF